MALLHQATVRPSKLELLTAWLPTRSWYTGPAGEALRVGTFRFDDPAGAVGIETLLVRVGQGPVYQVPLTYREAPLAGGEAWLLDTAEHSVLGKRWIYDGCGDPVYAAALAGAILANTGQAEELLEVDGELQRREPNMSIAVSAAEGAKAPAVGAIQRVTEGDPTVIVTDTVELTVVRRLEAGAELTGTELAGTVLTGTVLTGIWPGQASPAPLASAALR